MKRFLFFALLLPILTHAQNVNGKWTGTLDQSKSAALIPGYEQYWNNGLWKKGEVTHLLELTFQQDGDKLKGDYFVITKQEPDLVARFSIKGSFDRAKQTLYYRTVVKLHETTVGNTGFCYNEGHLALL